MTTPFVCVFVAFVACYLPKIPLSIAMARGEGGYDNRNPREQQARLTGWGARALAAHQNSFETFAPFAAAVIIAHLAGLDQHRTSLLAITFVVSRLAYQAAYLASLDYLRSALWAVGFLAISALFVLPMFG